MNTTNDIVKIALSEVGTKEKGVNNVKYNTWYYGKEVDGGKNQAYAWCMAFISWCANQAGVPTDIIPKENYCPDAVKFFKSKGIFKTRKEHTPKSGDIVFFDWNKNNAADHVGIVVDVTSKNIITVEGNKGDAVKKCTYKKSYSCILGYGIPEYTKEESKEEEEEEKYKPSILEWQKSAILDGFKFPKYGADGEWGKECESVAKNAIVKKRATYKYKNLTRILQMVVGVSVDGLCGKNTKKAIEDYQRSNGLVVDGECGINTWKKILGV